MRITVSPSVARDLVDWGSRYNEGGRHVPGITFGVLGTEDTSDDSGGKPDFLICTLERITPPGYIPHIVFYVGDTECGLQVPPEFKLLDELHFDYRNGKLVNVG